mgnify:CR=1 FL=1
MTNTKSTFIPWAIGVIVFVTSLVAPPAARAEISDADLAEKVIVVRRETSAGR